MGQGKAEHGKLQPHNKVRRSTEVTAHATANNAGCEFLMQSQMATPPTYTAIACGCDPTTDGKEQHEFLGEWGGLKVVLQKSTKTIIALNTDATRVPGPFARQTPRDGTP